jgi:anti-sigma factor RsiW
MNNMEEKLWNYIDGNCTPDEQKAISSLIEKDAAIGAKYRELLSLNASFAQMDLDEPPMAFTYNIMEAIRTENAQVPLKAAINKRIIRGIAIFFTLTLVALLVLVFASVKWSGQGLPASLTAHFKMPDISSSQTKVFVQAFVFFDVLLGLYLFDAYLRRKRAAKDTKML